MPIEALHTRHKKQMQGEVAWISGATGTIGRAVATALADEGATLIVSSRSHAALQAQAGDLGSRYGVPTLAIPMDVGDRQQVESAAEHIAHRADLRSDRHAGQYDFAVDFRRLP